MILVDIRTEYLQCALHQTLNCAQRLLQAFGYFRLRQPLEMRQL